MNAPLPPDFASESSHHLICLFLYRLYINRIRNEEKLIEHWKYLGNKTGKDSPEYHAAVANPT